MKKYLMSGLLACLTLVCCLLPVKALPQTKDAPAHADPETYTVCGHKGSEEPAEWTAWEQTKALPMTTGHYYLTADVTLPSGTSSVGLYYDSGAQVVICLNGHNITRQGSGRFFRISNGSNVTICDCTAHFEDAVVKGETVSVYRAGRIYGGNHAEGAVAWTRKFSGDSAAGTFTLYDGILTDNTSPAGNAAGVITVVDGDFTMHGGAITGNKSPDGMVYLFDKAATIHMTGGTIGGAVFHTDGNSVKSGNNGRGVLLNNGTFTMSGGTITANKYSAYGLGVRINNNAVFTMTGGEIVENEATGNTYGGGIAMMGAGKATIGENAKIIGNKAPNGGGIHIQAGEVILECGVLSGNIAKTGDGGGVYGINGTFTMTGGQIRENQANNGGGGIVAGSNLTVNVTGGEIINNTAKNGGGMVLQGANPKVTLKDMTITGNSASRNAGGIYLGYRVADTTVTSLTLGGKVTITDNTVGALQANLYMANAGTVVYEQALDSASCIGVRTRSDALLVKTGATADTVQCYVSDIQGRTFELRDDALYVVQAAHTAHEKDACGHADVTWTAWDNDTALPSQSGHYYLATDVILGSMWSVDAGQEITLCLNGYTVLQTASGQRVLRIGHGTVNLCDCTAHVQEDTYVAGRLTGGTTNASDGACAVLLTNKKDAQGQEIGKATFRIYEGIITGNETTGSGVVGAINGTTIEMHGGMICDNKVKDNGSGVFVNHSTFIMTGGTISKNKAGATGGGVRAEYSTMELSGGTIAGNKAPIGGGGIYLREGTLIMTGGVIEANEASGYAGIANMGGKLVVSGGSIRNNVSDQTAGGIGSMNYNQCEASVLISGGEIVGNISKLDGAGVRVDSGSFEMTGGTVANNIADGASGGGLRLGGGKAIISGGKITGNQAINGGGVLAMDTLTMTGGEISGNISSDRGGGIYVNKTTFQLEGGKITGNTAQVEGGGVYVNNSQVVMNSGAVDENKVIAGSGGGFLVRGEALLTVNGGTINGNEAFANGGGIMVQAGGQLAINDGQISKNTAAQSGGGVYMYKTALQMQGGKISDNTAQAYGGGIRVEYGTMELAGGTISGNYGKKGGGGVYNGGGTVTMTGGDVAGNKAPGYAGLANMGGTMTIQDGTIRNNTSTTTGGGIGTMNRTLDDGQVLEAVLTISGGTISGNTCVNDGAGVRMDSGTFNMTGGTISGNDAGKGSGGGMRVGGGTTTISGGTICGNKAVNGGGVLAMGKLVMTGGTIRDNVGGDRGGGVYMYKITFRMDGGKITGNTAKTEGGGLYVNTCQVVMNGGTVGDNLVTDGGGGGYLVRGEALLTVNGGTITGNKVTSERQHVAHGGGILVQAGGKVVMNGGKITGNHAPETGGGIRSHYCAVEIYGGEISDNIADREGSAIYTNDYIVIKNCRFSGNNATGKKQGSGAIKIPYGASAQIESCQFFNNTAALDGAVLNVNCNAKVTLKDCVFAGNSTSGNGGVFWLESSAELSMSGCSVENNSAAKGGVGYINARATVNICDSTFTGNTATMQASVFHCNGHLQLTDVAITGNTDQAGGAAVYLDGAGGDTESYLPGINTIAGNVTICDNVGGELVLVNDSFVHIGGDGLGEQAKLQVSIPDERIVWWVVGPYDFEKNGEMFTLTRGEASLKLANLAEPKQPEQETKETQPEETQTQPQTGETLPQTQDQNAADTGILVAAAAVILAAVAAAVILVLRAVGKGKARKA